MSKEIEGIITSHGFHRELLNQYDDIDFSVNPISSSSSYSLEIDLSSYIPSNKTIDDIVGIGLNAIVRKSSEAADFNIIQGSCLFFDKVTITNSPINDNGTRQRGNFVALATSSLVSIHVYLYENKSLKISVEPRTFDNLGTSFKPYAISCSALRIYYN